MITLYVKTGCPYCTVVLHTLAELELPFEEKNIVDPAIASELIEKGGKRQVPYLIDTEKGIAMYESADIADYLDDTYGEQVMPHDDPMAALNESITLLTDERNICTPESK